MAATSIKGVDTPFIEKLFGSQQWPGLQAKTSQHRSRSRVRPFPNWEGGCRLFSAL